MIEQMDDRERHDWAHFGKLRREWDVEAAQTEMPTQVREYILINYCFACRLIT